MDHGRVLERLQQLHVFFFKNPIIVDPNFSVRGRSFHLLSQKLRYNLTATDAYFTKSSMSSRINMKDVTI